ncbi:hypothetical protein CDD82_6750 [Ophiocordyceps australis]|uniref:Uncharacterized protein n=1 Tax=Ophiocordyceps australis TaxID=1399860 RepID=A0A2C5ZQT0_9HYPO|nr:hypothetical protein CDD82_6750 [Ophiocordyceps australis]
MVKPSHINMPLPLLQLAAASVLLVNPAQGHLIQRGLVDTTQASSAQAAELDELLIGGSPLGKGHGNPVRVNPGIGPDVFDHDQPQNDAAPLRRGGRRGTGKKGGGGKGGGGRGAATGGLGGSVGHGG